MAIYVEINGIQYPAVVGGRMKDDEWDNRASKFIKVEMPYAEAADIFVNDIKWNIVQDVVETVEQINEETGESSFVEVTKQEVYDNSEYSIAGDIIDHRDGYVTIKMGKPTADEILALFEEVL